MGLAFFIYLKVALLSKLQKIKSLFFKNETIYLSRLCLSKLKGIIMKWYFIVLKKFTQFSGRARRNEFWVYIIISLLIIMTMGITLLLAGLKPQKVNLIIQMFIFLNILPFSAVSVRRMKDLGKSGWYILIPIYNIYLTCSEGDVGQNKYGKDPKRYIPKRSKYKNNNVYQNA